VALPRRWGTPYCDIDVLSVNPTRQIVMRPRPHRGQGWRKGGSIFSKNKFSTEQKNQNVRRRVIIQGQRQSTLQDHPKKAQFGLLATGQLCWQ